MKRNLYIVLVCTLCMISSCATHIPEVDTTPPTFSFEIRGDGFSRTFTQEDNFSRLQLNLRSNTVYTFIYTGSDSGGVQLIQWQLGNADQISFLHPEFPADRWTIRPITFLTRMIEWNGVRSDPRTGAVLNGRFRTGDFQSSSGTFRFFISDYGGNSGASKSAVGSFNYSIGNFETELINF